MPEGSVFKGALERSNVTKDKADYRSFYTDELRELVEEKCKFELALFEYDFDGPTNNDAFISPEHLWYDVQAHQAMKYSQFIL